MSNVLPIAFTVLLAQQSFSWLRHDRIPRYDNLHARRAFVLAALKEALPQPPPNSEIVLVLPELIHLDANMSSLIEVSYHNLTLTAIPSPMRNRQVFLSRPMVLAHLFWRSGMVNTSEYKTQCRKLALCHWVTLA